MKKSKKGSCQHRGPRSSWPSHLSSRPVPTHRSALLTFGFTFRVSRRKEGRDVQVLDTEVVVMCRYAGRIHGRPTDPELGCCTLLVVYCKSAVMADSVRKRSAGITPTSRSRISAENRSMGDARDRFTGEWTLILAPRISARAAGKIGPGLRRLAR